MSSSSSESKQSSDSVRENLHTDSGDEDVLVVNSVVNPYASDSSQTQANRIICDGRRRR